MKYDSSFFDGLYKCNSSLLRSLCVALGVSCNELTSKVRLITDIFSCLNY